MLERFGLTKQEIAVYNQLSISKGKTGYVIAKEINMSRSNVYPLLNSLVKKGAVIFEDGESRKFYRVNPEEFLDNYINSLIEMKNEILKGLQEEADIPDGYFTIEGEINIKNKMNALVTGAENRVYVCGKKEEIFFLNDILGELCNENKKVVVITDKVADWNERIIVYKSDHDLLQMGLIVDSNSAMVGNITGEESNCLYSKNRNFVVSYKMNLKNEIEIIEMKRK